MTENQRTHHSMFPMTEAKTKLYSFTAALFAELHYRPEIMIQAMGRFSRLSGTVPSSVWLLVIEGSLDEVIADRLLNKMAAINSVVKGDVADAVLAAALKVDDADWRESLSEAFAKAAEERW